MDIGPAIDTAIHELGLEHRVLRLGAETAAHAVSAAEARFVERPGMRWWWEALRPGLAVVSRTPADGYRLVQTICPNEPAWLFASDDEDTPWPVYSGTPSDFVRVIGACHAFEYLVVSPRLDWLVIENHHGVMIAVGEPVATKLAQRDG